MAGAKQDQYVRGGAHLVEHLEVLNDEDETDLCQLRAVFDLGDPDRHRCIAEGGWRGIFVPFHGYLAPVFPVQAAGLNIAFLGTLETQVSADQTT